MSENNQNTLNNKEGLNDRLKKSAKGLLPKVLPTSDLSNLGEDKGSSQRYNVGGQGSSIALEQLPSGVASGSRNYTMSSRELVGHGFNENRQRESLPLNLEPTLVGDLPSNGNTTINYEPPTVQAMESGPIMVAVEPDIDYAAQLQQYRESVRNKNEVDVGEVEQFGYLGGKYLSSSEAISQINLDQEAQASLPPSYLPDLIDEDALIDGADVVQLLEEPGSPEDHEYSQYPSDMQNFEQRMHKKYGANSTPAVDAISYLDGGDYLEDVEGLVELLGKLPNSVVEERFLSVKDKRTALDRLTKIKNQVEDSTTES